MKKVNIDLVTTKKGNHLYMVESVNTDSVILLDKMGQPLKPIWSGSDKDLYVLLPGSFLVCKHEEEFTVLYQLLNVVREVTGEYENKDVSIKEIPANYIKYYGVFNMLNLYSFGEWTYPVIRRLEDGLKNVDDLYPACKGNGFIKKPNY